MYSVITGLVLCLNIFPFVNTRSGNCFGNYDVLVANRIVLKHPFCHNLFKLFGIMLPNNGIE